MLRWVLLALLFGFCASAGEKKKKSLSQGWGDDINWFKTYEEGLLNAVTSRKPLMVIHHRDECPFSQALKKAFVANKPIQKMAKQDFIMVNVVEEVEDPNMAPDGYYVPRILFVDPSMTVRRDIAGRYENRFYTYHPEDMDLLVKNMEKAKVLLPHTEL